MRLKYELRIEVPMQGLAPPAETTQLQKTWPSWHKLISPELMALLRNIMRTKQRRSGDGLGPTTTVSKRNFKRCGFFKVMQSNRRTLN